jgi:regulator of protease activity HflC (stomatin/prohibitin superfamily)
VGDQGHHGRDQDVEIPEAMQKAMARQAEAERERRAKIINSEGEFQAAQGNASRRFLNDSGVG